MRQKRIAAVNDISGVGKCSLTVALPIISAAGIECAALPTALLSTHTGGFGDEIYIKDLTDSILPIATHWKKEKFLFDALYSGYLGSAEQVDILLEVINMLKNQDTLVVVDPVMGDNGKLYKAISNKYPQKMRELCVCADIITPNITEAFLMLDEEYKEPPYTKDEITELLKKLSVICGGHIVLTGVCLGNNTQGAAALSVKENKFYFYETPKIEGMHHGTGDIFASVFVSAIVLGKGIEKALKTAVDFTAMAIENSKDNRPELWYGVNFESVLFKLNKMLEE